MAAGAPGTTIRQQYVRRLEAIEARVSDMADLARAMLRDGVHALAGLDAGLGHEVFGRREQLAAIDEEIEAEILHFLMLQAPVAGDLRRIGAALKLITYLNRVGRYGSDIARVAMDWPAGHEHIAKLVGIREMAAKVEGMLDQVLQAFHGNKAPDLGVLETSEEDVDAMRYAIFRECLTYMAEDPRNIEACAHYMMVARYLERCADNVCKMAEKQYYAATGKRVIVG